MELDVAKLLISMGLRILAGISAFGLVFLIDKLTKQNNEWDVKYIVAIVSLFTLFLTILDALGVY